MQSITALELAAWIGDTTRPAPFLLDVRELSEVNLCQIPNSFHIAMHSVPLRITELDSDLPIVCICHHGGRSMQVAYYLEQHGFSHVINLTGGVHAWATQVDSTMETY